MAVLCGQRRTGGGQYLDGKTGMELTRAASDDMVVPCKLSRVK